MTLTDLHAICTELASRMHGHTGATLQAAVDATAQAAAWARHREDNEHAGSTRFDIQRIVDAFGQLAEALAAVGMRVCDDGVYTAAWNQGGRVRIGEG